MVAAVMSLTMAVSWHGIQSRLEKGKQSARSKADTSQGHKAEVAPQLPSKATFGSTAFLSASPSEAAPANTDVASNIQFAFDSAKLDPASKTALDGIIAQISIRKQPIVEIHGYTDSVGAPEYNRFLSEERARAVRDYLVRSGSLEGVAMRVVGHGSDGTVAPNANADATDNPEGRGKNRRVEVRIYDSPAEAEHNP